MATIADTYALMYSGAMANKPLSQSREALIQAIQDRHLRQVDIAIAVGASQSQVSRVLSGETSERSRLYGRICDHVFGKSNRATRKHVLQCAVLIDAICEVWDGSNEQAKVLAHIIRSLTPLTIRSKGNGK